MSETEHQRTQREARERKRAAREARDKTAAAAQRRVVTFEVDKDVLLRVLDDEGLAPEGATKIIGTGHRPDVLTVTVVFD